MRYGYDDDDLIGDVPDEEQDERISLRTSDVHSVLGGVSVPWLMKAFRMGRQTVERKLAGCRPIGQGKHGTPLYDLPEAAAYLVKPRATIEQLLASLKPDELPEKLREAYWNAKLKQQRYEERAGHLWRTDRVIALFSEVLQEIRVKLQIIPDRVDRETGLTSQQLKSLSRIVDEVQDDIYQYILSLKDKRYTPSQLGEEVEPESEDYI